MNEENYFNPLQFAAGVYPAVRASSMEAKVMRFVGEMVRAPAQNGK